MKNDVVFNAKRMPEKWRRHFKIYRAKISIYLDTADFGIPLMVDGSEMMEFLPAGIDDPSFVQKTGPMEPGAESVWIEAEVPEGMPSRPNVRRIGAMVHHSSTRTNFILEPWTGADSEYMIEAYLRDADGLATRLEHDVRFRLDDRGFLSGLELMKYQSALRPGGVFTNGGKSDLHRRRPAARQARRDLLVGLAGPRTGRPGPDREDLYP